MSAGITKASKRIQWTFWRGRTERSEFLWRFWNRQKTSSSSCSSFLGAQIMFKRSVSQICPLFCSAPQRELNRTRTKEENRNLKMDLLLKEEDPFLDSFIEVRKQTRLRTTKTHLRGRTDQNRAGVRVLLQNDKSCSGSARTQRSPGSKHNPHRTEQDWTETARKNSVEPEPKLTASSEPRGLCGSRVRSAEL